jgi:hypothetical protein
MSQKKRKRSHRLYGRTVLKRNVVDEIGIERQRAISVSILTEHPELADEQVARNALHTMVTGGSSL